MSTSRALPGYGWAMKRVMAVALAAGLLTFAMFFHAHAQQEPTAAKQMFETNCATCHGPGGAGSERLL